MLSPDDILKLAQAYSAATGLSFSRISRRVTGDSNDKLLWRLSNGFGINARTAMAAEEYFRANWPENVPWPREVPGRPRKTIAAVYSRRFKSTENVID